jgi:hypothetical protein
MPLCGAAFNESSVPLDKGGLHGGSWTRNQPIPALRATAPSHGIFKRGRGELRIQLGSKPRPRRFREFRDRNYPI